MILDDGLTTQDSNETTSTGQNERLLCCKDCMNYIWMSNANKKARKRLGRKISFIGLYDSCYLIDKHE